MAVGGSVWVSVDVGGFEPDVSSRDAAITSRGDAVWRTLEAKRIVLCDSE